KPTPLAGASAQDSRSGTVMPGRPPAAIAQPPTSECPGPEVLRDFSRGRLPADRLEVVGKHLSGCPYCESLLSTLDDDSDVLISSLRDPAVAAALPQEACRRLEQLAQAIPLQSTEETRAYEGPAPPAPELSGELGPYRLVRTIRAGGMGV